MKHSLMLVLCYALLGITAHAGPTLNATPAAIFNFHYFLGMGPSIAQSAVLQSPLMATSSGTVTATSSTYYEISLDNSSFSGSLSIPYSGDTLGATTIYIRLKAGLPLSITNYNGGGSNLVTFTATGVGAMVQMGGLVTSTPNTISISNVTMTTAKIAWGPDQSADSWAYKLDQSPTPPGPSDIGTSSAVTVYNANNLLPNTTYYFHVRSKYNPNYTSWVTQSFTTGSTTGVSSTTANGQPALTLIPSPSKGDFILSCDLGESKMASVTITDVIGRAVWQSSIQAVNRRVNQALHTGLPAGMYVVRVSSGSLSLAVKMIICE